MSKLILKDNTSFEKDLSSGAIINRDIKTYNALKRKKELKKEKEKEMAELKSDVKNLTSLVEKLIQKIDK
jgi:hypothetical protein